MTEVTAAQRAELFFAKIQIGHPRQDGTRCLLWTAAVSSGGYGIFQTGQRTEVAHRWLWRRWFGDIPGGHELHHEVCATKRCVNPVHLRPMTKADHAKEHHTLRGEITHCPVGHEYDEANTYTHPSRGYRCCRACHRQREADRAADGRKKPRSRRGVIDGRPCVVCGSDLPGHMRIDAKYCSDRCRSISRRLT